MTARILFVDDDPQLLSALKRVLHRDRGHWEMVFVHSGQQAIDELGRGAFDVVVSDMRMPEINGTALLAHVKRESPRTMRLILSGTADIEDMEKAQAVAHALLGKPCPVGVLRAAITQILEPVPPA
jgi:DNA-binding NtrC family response regulator